MAGLQPLPKMKVDFMKTVAINGEPAQNRMQILDNPLDSPTQPWKPGIGPSGPYMKHENVLFAGASGETGKCIAPEANALDEGERHGSAFISKSTMIQVDLIQIFRQHVLVCVV